MKGKGKETSGTWITITSTGLLLVVRLGFVGICNKEDRWRDERVQGCKGVKLNLGYKAEKSADRELSVGEDWIEYCLLNC